MLLYTNNDDDMNQKALIRTLLHKKVTVKKIVRRSLITHWRRNNMKKNNLMYFLF